jgi:hypothetical protein
MHTVCTYLCKCSVPEDYKINPGAVEAIAEQPGNADKILIGYNRGLVVLWDRRRPGADQVPKTNCCNVIISFSSNMQYKPSLKVLPLY